MSSFRTSTTARFLAAELVLWAALYTTYLAVRGATIGDQGIATEHATRVVHLEHTLDLAHERWLQHLVHPLVDGFSAYYMVGFGPTLAAVLAWLALRRRALYRELRTLLFVSLALAVVAYVRHPTAPPRLVPALHLADTATGNHYFLDSIAGATVALLAVAAVHGWRRTGLRLAISPMRSRRGEARFGA